MGDPDFDDLIKSAVGGDKSAAERIIRSIQGKVYSLCLRMLWQREDAQEACQEILVKAITHLSQFAFKSKFETWVFQIASNHIIDKKRASDSAKGITFSSFEEELLSGQIEPSDEERNAPDFRLQLSEIRISCTTALLQCLDPVHRMAYVLGEILEFEHTEGAAILGISPSNFRKRLERARSRVEDFTGRVCGVISSAGNCACQRRLNYSKACGRIDLKGYPLLKSSGSDLDVLNYIRKIGQAKRTAAHYRKTGRFESPHDYAEILEIIGPTPTLPDPGRGNAPRYRRA